MACLFYVFEKQKKAGHQMLPLPLNLFDSKGLAPYFSDDPNRVTEKGIHRTLKNFFNLDMKPFGSPPIGDKGTDSPRILRAMFR